LHLAEIAATVAPAAHAILLVDQAGWHLSTRLLVPANPKCHSNRISEVAVLWRERAQITL
jgi:hypothetical protein